MEIKIAFIPPAHQDYLADTILDGLIDLKKEFPSIQFFLPVHYPFFKEVDDYVLPERQFYSFAETADLIVLCFGKRGTFFDIAQRINKWRQTVFVDGLEVGKSGRLEPEKMKQILSGVQGFDGSINLEMLKKCGLYVRREKPYEFGIEPLPFGILRSYQNFRRSADKDLDFVCVFGQEKHPPLRKEVREAVAEFSVRNGLKSITKNTSLPFFNIHSRLAKKRFYNFLNRAKVGVSVSGGGYDTLRFWEILGNNCILLTEKIDIFREPKAEFSFKRVFEFEGQNGLEKALASLLPIIKNGLDDYLNETEYRMILEKHSSKARVVKILEYAQKRGIINF